jgi:protein TonB
LKETNETARAITRYQPRRRLSWPMLAAIGALHAVGLYALAHWLAPDMSASIEREVIAAFDIPAPTPQPTPPPPPPPPENRSEPDEGAQGAPGREAVPEPVIAPPVVLPTAPPRPRASSTGPANTSGARETGEGTGASGTGTGTGSGNRGSGGGGVAVTRPVHVSGAIENARDYPVPPGGRAARRGNEVIVRVIVGIDGTARNCTVYRPSADPEADRITCRLVEQRLGFEPARDAAGNPVPAPFYWRQSWF